MPYKKLGLISTEELLKALLPYLKNLGFLINAISCFGSKKLVASDFQNEFSPDVVVAVSPDEVILNKQVDMVLIVAHPHFHCQLVTKALGIGKHVACCPPGALSVTDSRSLVRSSLYYPQLLSLLIMGLRQTEVFRHMRRLISSGSITGDKISVCDVRVHCPPLVSDHFDWSWDIDTGGGVLNLVGTHVIDLLQFLLGGRRADRVQGLVRLSDRSKSEGFRNRRIDDYCSILMQISGGISATITLEMMTPVTQFRQEIAVVGDKGRLIAKNLDLYALKIDNNDEELLYSEECAPNLTKLVQLLTDTLRMPRDYGYGFFKALESLSEAMPHYDAVLLDCQERERSLSQNFADGGEFKRPAEAAPQGESSWRDLLPQLGVGNAANFSDALYARAVIQAVRHSSELGSWIRVNTDTKEE